ncbi:MAG: fluoride efflux transporter CrcB [Acidobacteriota bacterium]|jgi:CrcB protein|nr:fluoride efflux transporter CrcB [Acidobacteriota bacterium]
MLNYLLIALGSAIGGVARYWASGVIETRIGQTFPWGTLFVNVTGSFVIGFLASIAAPESRFFLSPYARNFLMIGLCGGYTTFSSFSVQTLNLARDKEWLYAGSNAVFSLVLCLISVWLGSSFAQAINPDRGA